jgi:hypothetical protein
MLLTLPVLFRPKNSPSGHQELMEELYEHFKKNQKDDKSVMSAKKKITNHGLAPCGMSIPMKGHVYVVGGITLRKNHWRSQILICTIDSKEKKRK